MIGRSLISLAALLLLWILPGCGGGETAQPEPAEHPIERTAELGPVRLAVRLDRDELRVGDELHLTIEAVAETGVDVSMPQFEDAIGPFDILERTTPPDVPVDGRRRWRHAYRLSTFESGELAIPSIELEFVDRRDGAQADEATGSTLASEPIPVTVTTVLAESDDPLATRKVRDPVYVRAPMSGRLIAAIVGGAVLALALLILIIGRLTRSRRAVPWAAPALPPHVWALGELDRLAGDSLIERGEVQAYYFRLSDIVRSYIERRYGLMAPERTTNEFLREARRHQALRELHRTLLASFLRTADMVKFALHRPTAADADEAWSAARRFVEETAPIPVAGEPTSNGERTRRDAEAVA
jgi:hypothetical protein